MSGLGYREKTARAKPSDCWVDGNSFFMRVPRCRKCGRLFTDLQSLRDHTIFCDAVWEGKKKITGTKTIAFPRVELLQRNPVKHVTINQGFIFFNGKEELYQH